jgi:UDP-3-O-[3-hydroxymyristoyl] glucosamine N-acyltransferase
MKIADLAAALGGTLHGDGTLEVVRPVHPADAADGRDVAVAMGASLLPLLAATRARTALVPAGAPIPDGALAAWIEVGRPRYAMHKLNALFEPPPFAPPGIHPTAVVEAGAEIGEGCAIGPFVHVGPGARIGAGTIVMSHVSVGEKATVGRGCLIHAGVRIAHRCTIGDRVIIHQNASIGADGFSFVTPERGSVEAAKATGRVEEGTRNVVIERIASLGGVTIGDDVEIGALTAIDRGTLRDTRIGPGTKIDDLVMIGHNVVVGSNCMLCGQAGIAGSTVIGDRVVLGGRAAVADNLRIGDDVVAAGGAAIGSDVEARQVVIGMPAIPKSEFFSQLRNLKRLKALFSDVAEIRRRLG